jgi:ABC-2 type transport system permease protein
MMRAILAIAWRDFQSLILSPLMHLILGFCAVLMSFFYMRNLIFFASRSRTIAPGTGEGPSIQMEIFAQHISLVHLLLILVTPVLTMRLLAEEKRMRTYDLLLTSPVTATQIAVGKYLAGFYSAMTLVAVSFLYPLGTAMLTNFQWGPLLSAYLGLMLVVAIYVAIGLFASSLSESILLSVVLGWLLSLMIFFVGQAAYNNTDPFWSPVFDHLSMAEHFYSFILGTIKTKSLVFMLSVVSLFVFLTQRVVESSRWR